MPVDRASFNRYCISGCRARTFLSKLGTRFTKITGVVLNVGSQLKSYGICCGLILIKCFSWKAILQVAFYIFVMHEALLYIIVLLAYLFLEPEINIPNCAKA